MKKKYRILVLDQVAERGVEALRAVPEFDVEVSKSLKEDELVSKIGSFHALVLRSQTKVTEKAIQAAKKLKVIGRAGVGVDNIDVEEATEKGIVVMNTPGGNTVSTAEHTMSLLLGLARNIPQANQSTRSGKWERKKFQGTEICNKTLGILGAGRIGSEVARRALAFGMRVLAYDPYLSVSRAKSMQVELFDDLNELLPHCDFITVHMPLTKETKNMLNKDTLALCKPTARIINCARGGLVDEKALEKALKNKKLAGAAIDVFEVEPLPKDFPLFEYDSVIMTPHLGASTYEAQESVGIEVAEAIRDMLVNGSIRNAVNMPNVDVKTLAVLRPYLDLGVKLGKAMAQIACSRCDNLTITYYGKISEQDTTSVTRAILKGYLMTAGGDNVNEVNAPTYAANLGIKYQEVKQSETEDYSELIAVEARRNGKIFGVKGTYFGTAQRIVNINGYPIDVCPEGVLLMLENMDRPGIVGRVGTLMGKLDINIGNMSLSRSAPDSKALCVLNLDSMPPDSAVEKIKQDDAIYDVLMVQF